MEIQVTNGPTWGVDPKFNAVCGFDEGGHPRPLKVESGGGLSLSLPSGAATEAKQPVIGTAGMPSVDVLTVQGRSGMTPVTSVGLTHRSSAEFTRPSDTTAYAAGDVVCNSTSAPTMVTFSNVARVSGGTGIVISARLTTNNTNATNGNFRLYLHNEAVSIANDNAAYALNYADAGKRIGYVDFVLSAESAGDCAVALTTGVNLDYAAVTQNLFGVLVAKGAYVPASGQKFMVELGTTND